MSQHARAEAAEPLTTEATARAAASMVLLLILPPLNSSESKQGCCVLQGDGSNMLFVSYLALMNSLICRPVAWQGLALLLMALVQPAHASSSLLIPSAIACVNGSVAIRRTGPVLVEGNTRAAAYVLVVNGQTEAATGIEHGNYTKVVSRHYTVFGGTGGLSFSRNHANGTNQTICTNSKYGTTTPGFRSR